MSVADHLPDGLLVAFYGDDFTGSTDALEVLAFGDEEGTRFRTTLAGSRAVIGDHGDDLLTAYDADGRSMREAMTASQTCSNMR